jgi:hypothetical protein
LGFASRIVRHPGHLRGDLDDRARPLRNALDNTWPNQIRTGDAPHAAYLVNIGLIGPNPAGDYQPTPALLDAFPK